MQSLHMDLTDPLSPRFGSLVFKQAVDTNMPDDEILSDILIRGTQSHNPWLKPLAPANCSCGNTYFSSIRGN
jgi:hypothetical protein